MMIAAAVILLGLIFGALMLLAYLLTQVNRSNLDVVTELRELRLHYRTRIAQASVQSGAVSDEQKLERLGRASAARRVVVGGDDASVQKQNLIRQTRVGGEEE